MCTKQPKIRSMIGCEVSGGLGNQFFRYAFARSLQEKRKLERGEIEPLFINYNSTESHGVSGNLSDFNIIQHQEHHCRRLLISFGSFWQKILYACLTKGRCLTKLICGKEKAIDIKYRLLGKAGIIISENPDNENLYFPSISENKIFTIGSFENATYFENVKEQLLKEFTPKHPEQETNRDLYDIIRNTNSVCLAIRRGDFLNPENKSTFHVCNLTYYRNAIKYIQEHIENPTFIVFSNDLNWVKQNIKINGNVFYESGNDPVWETFRLMYSCKHFIISNSTLHWWAQYKGNYKDKIVIAPNIWYNAPGWEQHLMLDYFIKVN